MSSEYIKPLKPSPELAELAKWLDYLYQCRKELLKPELPPPKTIKQ